MALELYDRVKETSTTTGTGAFTLGGAFTGFRTFGSVLADADTTYYTIELPSLGEWEVGLGTIGTSGTVLTRTSVMASSNGGAAVNFSAGTKTVFVTAPAALFLNPQLTAIAGLTSAADKLPYFTGAGTAALADFTAGGRALVNSAGTANTFPYFSASNVVTLASITAAGLAVVAAANSGAQRTALGVAIGSDVQAYDADLAAIAGLSSNGLIARTGAGTAAVRTMTAGNGIAVTNGDGVSGDPTIAVDKATAANIWAATSNKVITADGINSALAPIAPSGASNWAPDWAAFTTADWVVTATRVLSNPTNMVVGTTRIINITASTSTPRTITFGTDYDNVPTITDATNTKCYTLVLYARAANSILITSVGYAI